MAYSSPPIKYYTSVEQITFATLLQKAAISQSSRLMRHPELKRSSCSYLLVINCCLEADPTQSLLVFNGHVSWSNTAAVSLSVT